MNLGNKDVHFLVVDDDQVDVLAVNDSLQKNKIANPVITARDWPGSPGNPCAVNGRDKLPRPYLILLDLNMPRMNGLQFLEELRKDPELSDSIVFVLSTSASEKDKTGAYRHHIAGYLSRRRWGKVFRRPFKCWKNSSWWWSFRRYISKEKIPPEFAPGGICLFLPAAAPRIRNALPSRRSARLRSFFMARTFSCRTRSLVMPNCWPISSSVIPLAWPSRPARMRMISRSRGSRYSSSRLTLCVACSCVATSLVLVGPDVRGDLEHLLVAGHVALAAVLLVRDRCGRSSS